MPVYTYRCPECGTEDEEVMSIAEYAETSQHGPPLCMVCLAEMQRTYSVPSFTIDGLAKDRFKYKDKIAENRQVALERGEI